MNQPDLLSQYDTYLELKGVSLNTRKRYQSFLTSLFRFVELNPSEIAHVTTAHLRTFVAGLQERRLADRTVASSVTMLKTFFGYAVAEGHLERNPATRLPNPKIGRRLPRTLSPEEVRALFAAIAQGKSNVDRRNLIIFHLCYVCGLRIGEVVTLRREQIDLEGATLRVIGKGDKERLLYLKPRTVELLKDYLTRNGIQDYMFPGAKNSHLTPSALQSKFRSYVKAAGFTKHVTVHALRHSVAVHYLMGGAPISFVQQLLGHENLQTTGIYTRLTDAMTKQIALNTVTALDDQSERMDPERKVLEEARVEHRDEKAK